MIAGDLLGHQKRLRPNQVALTYAGKEYTYALLVERVNRAANALREMGIRKGERVAVLSQNCNQYIEIYFANGKAGSVTVPLNYRLTPTELEFIINNSDAVALIVSEDFLQPIAQIKHLLPNIRKWIVIGGSHQGYLSYEDLIAGSSPAEPPEVVNENDLIWQMYTSGTTGRPKGAMITHRNLITNIVQTAMNFRAEPEDRSLIVAPIYHAAAMIVSTTTLAQGGTLLIKKDFIPPEVIKAFDQEGVTHALLVPAMILFLLNMPGIEKVNFGSLKYVIYGASAIPLEVLRKAMQIFKCNFLQGFGQTESTAVLTQLMPEDHVLDGKPEKVRRLESCGRELFGTEVRIVDENGNDCPPGVVGEIIARGDQIMQGYWKLPEATAETLKGGWLHTGDMGTFDEEGYVYIKDRMKDMIVSGGENVYPREIEEVLFTHPAVADAACIGVPSDQWGEEIKAIVVLKPDAKASADDIIEFCRGKLAGFKRPRSVDFAQALPKNPSGKVLKRELREPFWKDKGRRVN
jgi:fatty-acyl-CoA synthase